MHDFHLRSRRIVEEDVLKLDVSLQSGRFLTLLTAAVDIWDSVDDTVDLPGCASRRCKCFYIGSCLTELEAADENAEEDDEHVLGLEREAVCGTFKCLLEVRNQENADLYWLQLFDFSPFQNDIIIITTIMSVI